MAGLVSVGEERMADLEARLRAVEDRLAIIDLVSRYGPAVDSLDGQSLAELWAEDGAYAFDSVTLEGQEVAQLVDLPGHRAYVEAGCGHILTSPRVEIDGDSAVAVNHSMLVLRSGESWRVERLSANRWELERGHGGWRVRRRTNALLDGSRGVPRLFDRR
ncbi:nuclear transport factor 2 family protein [Microbacterium sp. CFH 31415]|uniref:nuclear transport factor 2 family protein n=1 Tax=Microbacterium sp. CFH 31415 TaxID=2921732 RepID=UPI001F146D8B|nr:nuclear transport factor 2 family protein [Microbacterium sp. CFH 31415]MCH6231650.1 nuclear transport factor 2 family protein [Microbacterium sp. CFH 31415]